MNWFSKISGGGSKTDKPPREFDRYTGSGETVEILIDNSGSGKSYELLDVSFGGFAIKGYEGTLHGNQYFEFKFCGKNAKGPAEITGFANIVRVKDGMLAAKFTPQPRVKSFLRDYINQR
ncbi:MAG: hypothetical protein HQ483_03080 [Rhodospirillales bacterium]|nr:hypothetical protein [Rhodospirillales bacterium]